MRRYVGVPPVIDHTDSVHAHIGIVSALPIEMAAFLRGCDRVRKNSGGEFTFRGGRIRDIRIASGMGFARARRATTSLIEAHTPEWILSCGFSGALRPGIEVGHIVVADSIVDTHGNDASIAFSMPEREGVHVGRIVMADEFVTKSDDKQQLGETYDALAVDLESLAVAQVCRELKRRFLAIRAISDDMSTDLPPEILSVIGATGSLRLGAALGAIWQRQGAVGELWKLRENAHRAADRLAAFVYDIATKLVDPDFP